MAGIIEKLIKEKNIIVVEPNLNISTAYDKKSISCMGAAKLLLENNYLEESVGLIYYSLYHKSTSLLMLYGIKCKNHMGVLIILKEIFNINNNTIKLAKQERLQKQYYVDCDTTKEEVKRLLEISELFCIEIDYFIDTTNSKEMNKLRNKFIKKYYPLSL